MSLIVVGMSHHATPVAVLERVALDGTRRRALDDALRASEHLGEWMIISTCNRIEVYADVESFHGAVAQVAESISATTGFTVDEIRTHLYVHYEDRAVAHLFDVAAGLDSMAVGESQILAQLRDGLRQGQQRGSVGPALSVLAQQALRVGKRVHSETEIDSVSRSLVQQALTEAGDVLGPLSELTAAVVGAGAMSALSAHTLARAGIGALRIVNRTPARAARLAEATGGVARPWDELEQTLAEADVVVSCTGALGHVIDRDLLPATADRDRPLVLIDLALPRDIDPDVADLPQVRLISLESLQESTLDDSIGRQVRVAEELVTAEVAEFVVGRRAASVGPIVAALRSRVAEVVDSELSRLSGRVELSEADEAQVRLAVHRIVEKLLHTPTVRMKQLAAADAGADYQELVQTLFDLDPHISRVAVIPPEVQP